jgi:hypothetical protein
VKSVLNSKEPSYLLCKEPICYRFYNVQVQNNKVKLTIQQRDITENNVAIIKQLQEEEKEIQAAKDIHVSMVTLLSCTSINTYIYLLGFSGI